MAGIDHITEEILAEAKQKAGVIISSAQSDAAEMKKAAEEQCRSFEAKASEKTAQSVKAFSERVESQKGMRARKAILQAKQELIEEIICEAYKRLDAQDDSSYFSMIEMLIEGNAQKGAGEILLSARDLARLPKNFEMRANAIAAKKGGSLQVGKEPAAIENGFILRYNGIDENCTLSALFAEKKEILQDRVHSVLW